MRWTLAVSTVRKVCVSLVDSENIGEQSVLNVARMVKEAKVKMARGQGKKGKSSKGKTDDGKGKVGKWQARIGNGVTWKRIASKSKVKGGKGKSASSLDELHFSWWTWFVLVWKPTW